MAETKKGKDVLQELDFGQVELRLKELLAEKNVSRSMLSKQTGLRYDLVMRYYNNELERYDRTVIGKICYCLDCNVSDLLCYIPPKK